jgi:hypothetical protein
MCQFKMNLKKNLKKIEIKLKYLYGDFFNHLPFYLFTYLPI